MNLPNKLTIIRILLIPIIIIIYSINYLRSNWILWPNLTIANFIILLIIMIGAITDFLDGQIARKKNLVTNLGKFLDPLADKLLTSTAFIILLHQNFSNQLDAKFTGTSVADLITWWMIIIIFAREFMVTGIRLLAAGQGKVIAASKFGKAKTTLQFLTIIFVFAGGAVNVNGTEMINNLPTAYVVIAKILIFAMLAVTIFSGYDYLSKNFDVLREKAPKKKDKKEMEK